MTDDNPHGRLRIAVVIGSVREARLADPLAAWLERELAAWDWVGVDMIDLASVSLPMHEVQPRAVFPELRATTVRESVLLPMAWNHLDAAGRFDPPPGTVDALHVMMKELAVWARALRSARVADRAGRP